VKTHSGKTELDPTLPRRQPDARETEIQGETKKKLSEENEQTGENGVTSITKNRTSAWSSRTSIKSKTEAMARENRNTGHRA
jgi:hypothetical protein